MKNLTKSVLRRVGFEIKRYREHKPPFELYGVDAIFDIGANTGQSALGFRSAGFRGPIVSFEPVSHLFAALQRNAQGDPLWRVERRAIGDTEGELDMNVSGGHAGASSLLDMTQLVMTHAPDQRARQDRTLQRCNAR